MPRAKVIITDFVTEPLDDEQRILGDLAEVTTLDAHGEDELIGRIEDADALMVYHCIQVTARVIERLTRCTLIVRCGVGSRLCPHARHSHGQHSRLRHRGRRRHGHRHDDDARARCASDELATAPPRRRVALHAGRAAAPAARTGVRHHRPWPHRRRRGAAREGAGNGVVFFDPYVPDGKDKSLGLRRAESLEELLKQSHLLSVHCPLTDETRRMLDDSAIALLPPGAIVVNTARGAVVDVLAVLRAIQSGHLAGAGIDVLEKEPPPDDDPLLKAWRDPQDPAHDRLILNPHSAFYTEEGLREMRVKGSENVRRVLLGNPPRNVVN